MKLQPVVPKYVKKSLSKLLRLKVSTKDQAQRAGKGPSFSAVVVSENTVALVDHLYRQAYAYCTGHVTIYRVLPTYLTYF